MEVTCFTLSRLHRVSQWLIHDGQAAQSQKVDKVKFCGRFTPQVFLTHFLKPVTFSETKSSWEHAVSLQIKLGFD